MARRNPRRLSASVVVTIGLLAGCGADAHRNPPPPQPMDGGGHANPPGDNGHGHVNPPSPVPDRENPPAPVPDAEPAPEPDAALPEAPEGAEVQKREDGSCFYVLDRSAPCPPGKRCNPPPPQDADVRCPD
jgi:hypothetical protein